MKSKTLLLVLFVCILLFSCSPEIDSDEKEEETVPSTPSEQPEDELEQADDFTFTFRYAYQSKGDKYSNWSVYLDAKSNLNEVSNLEVYATIKLANGYKYTSPTVVESFMPQELKQICLHFGTYNSDTLKDGQIEVFYNSEGKSSVTIPSSLTTPLTDDEILDDLLGVWRHYIHATIFDSIYHFNEDGTAFVIYEDGSTATGKYSVENGVLTLSDGIDMIVNVSEYPDFVQDSSGNISRFGNSSSEAVGTFLYSLDSSYKPVNLTGEMPRDLVGEWSDGSGSVNLKLNLSATSTESIGTYNGIGLKSWSYSDYRITLISGSRERSFLAVLYKGYSLSKKYLCLDGALTT